LPLEDAGMPLVVPIRRIAVTILGAMLRPVPFLESPFLFLLSNLVFHFYTREGKGEPFVSAR
jgi:hypothetical protein